MGSSSIVTAIPLMISAKRAETIKSDKKSVFITGASSGIGEALAQYLAGLGCTVAISARSEDKLKDIAKEDKHVDEIEAENAEDAEDESNVERHEVEEKDYHAMSMQDLESRTGKPSKAPRLRRLRGEDVAASRFPTAPMMTTTIRC